MIKKVKNRTNLNILFAIIIGTVVGLISMYVCIILNLAIFGFNIYFIISPLIAGFVETYISQELTNKSSGAISAIILFIITNILGWLFPVQPIKWNIFTVGGLLLMIQAAIPLTINYLLLGMLFVFTYIFGVIGGYFGMRLRKNEINSPLDVEAIVDIDDLGVLILNNKPDFPIKEYHGIIFAEEVIRFNDKKQPEKMAYYGSELSQKMHLKYQDYIMAKKYILHTLQEEAVKINANAIIDIEIEYTNYNQHLPPDMLIVAYGTAVTIDEKYLN